MLSAVGPRGRARAAYGIATALVAAAAIVRWLLSPLLGAATPFLIFTAPVFVAARIGGFAPGLYATGLGMLVSSTLFVTPSITTAQHVTSLIAFAIIGAGASWLSERAREVEHEVSSAHAVLERLRLLTSPGLARFEMEPLLSELMNRLVAVLRVDTACVLLLSDDGRDLCVRSSHGLEEAVQRKVRIPVGRGFAGRIASEGQPVVLPEVDHSQVVNPVLREKGVRSLAGVPMMIGGRVIGVLHVGTLHPREFSDDDVQLLQIVAARVALTIDYLRALQTEREHRQTAESVSRAKDQFLATVSHELRTPLNVILGWLSTLRAGALEGADMERAFAAIDRNIRLQARLIEDLLDVSRSMSGRLQLEARQTELQPSVEAAIDVLRPAAEAKRLQITTQFDPDVGPVLGDPGPLQQIAWNLLANAVKFTPAEGRVEVAIRRVGIRVQLRVSDTGIGIADDFRPHMFDAFRQADQTSTRAYSGLGLGLTIVKQLVEAHGASLHVASEGIGQGATFTVEFPVPAVRDVAVPAVRPAARSGPRLDGLRVLIVDDEPDALQALSVALGSLGAEVAVARSAEEALAMVDQLEPHALLADIAMPGGLDGIGLIRAIRERSALVTMPAVAVSAYSRTDHEMQALDSGYQMYVEKPVHPGELATQLQGLLGGSRAH